MSTPLIIAHRGGALEAPENTLPAMVKALAAGAHGVECDIRRTSDGILVVHHDAEVRGAPPPLELWLTIEKTPWATLEALDLAWTHGPEFSGLRMPTLLALLEVSPDAQFMIEIKPDGADHEALAISLARDLAGHPRRDRCVFGSFSPGLLGLVHERDRDLRLQGIVSDPVRFAEFRGLPLVGWGIDRALATAECLAELGAGGRWVWSWTVKNVAQAEALRVAGIDGLITDIPARLLKDRSG